MALRDALLGVKIPFIEVHLSNVYARESFRHHSYFSDIAIGTITGLGAFGYELALRAAANYLTLPSQVALAFFESLSALPQEKNKRIRMDIRKVKKLIELLEESGIAEIEISEGEEVGAHQPLSAGRRPRSDRALRRSADRGIRLPPLPLWLPRLPPPRPLRARPITL